MSINKNGQNEYSASYTISTHNGSSVARQHNLRNGKVVSKEDHIRINGIHETWLDIKPSLAYQKLFGAAVAEYNQLQIERGHSERQIKSYYKKVQDDKQKHAVYEMIIGIGSYDHHPDEQTSKQIMMNFCKTWKQRNPNLIMIGCYYHADEIGVCHTHIDYIPIATKLTRGMHTQSSLTRALNQMGYETKSTHDTAQIQWERDQNSELERLCREHGLDIVHSDIENQKHLDMKEYRQRKQIEELERRNAELERKNLEMEAWIQQQKQIVEKDKQKAKELYIQAKTFAEHTITIAESQTSSSCKEHDLHVI